MPTDLFMAYVDQMPRIRAQRLLDAVEAQGVQHMERDALHAWYDRTLGVARGDDETAPATPRGPFRLNGQAIAVHDLKAVLASAMKDEFSEAA